MHSSNVNSGKRTIRNLSKFISVERWSINISQRQVKSVSTDDVIDTRSILKGKSISMFVGRMICCALEHFEERFTSRHDPVSLPIFMRPFIRYALLMRSFTERHGIIAV